MCRILQVKTAEELRAMIKELKYQRIKGEISEQIERLQEWNGSYEKMEVLRLK